MTIAFEIEERKVGEVIDYDEKRRMWEVYIHGEKVRVSDKTLQSGRYYTKEDMFSIYEKDTVAVCTECGSEALSLKKDSYYCPICY